MKTLMANLQKYYGVYLLIVAVLFLILWFPNRAVNRYAICMGDGSGVWILDTKTGQLYFKGGQAVVNFGTLTKPIIPDLTLAVKSGKKWWEKCPNAVRLDSIPDTNALKIPEGFELEEVPKK